MSPFLKRTFLAGSLGRPGNGRLYGVRIHSLAALISCAVTLNITFDLLDELTVIVHAYRRHVKNFIDQ